MIPDPATNRPQQLTTLIRARDWWSYKVPPVLGTAYATATISHVTLISLWQTFLLLLVALVIGSSYACVINNVCDQKEDRLSGKNNLMIGRSNLFIGLVLTACIVPGLAVSRLMIQAPLALTVYAIGWLLFTIYSLPPIRLKQRGFLGVLAIGLADSVIPQLFALFLVAHATGKPLSSAWSAIIIIWALASGLRSILWHQIEDFEGDYHAGVTTFAVHTSTQTLRKVGEWLVFPIEAISLFGLLLLVQNSLVWFFLSLYLLTEWLRSHFWKANVTVVEPATNDRLLLFEYYDFFYPLGLLLLDFWKHPSNLILLAAHTLLFPQRLKWWIRDLWGLLRWEVIRKI